MKKDTQLDLTKKSTRAKVFKSLANPSRIAILEYLSRGPCCVNLASLKLHMTQPNISKQLKILKDAGLVGCKMQGASRCYFLCRPTLLEPMLSAINQVHEYVPCSKLEQKN